MSENGTIHITMIKKDWVSHILFLRKKGAYRIPDSAEKGPVLCHSHIKVVTATRRFHTGTGNPIARRLNAWNMYINVSFNVKIYLTDSQHNTLCFV